jgi:hypothetical protein
MAVSPGRPAIHGPPRSAKSRNKRTRRLLTSVVDWNVLELYSAGMLRGVPALPLFASSIRNHEARAGHAPGPSGRLSGRAEPGAPALRRRRFPLRNLRNCPNSKRGPSDRGCDLEAIPGSLSETSETSQTSRTADSSAGIARFGRRMLVQVPISQNHCAERLVGWTQSGDGRPAGTRAPDTISAQGAARRRRRRSPQVHRSDP